MTPLDWVALPVYLLTPMAFIFAGNGDLRKKDERYLAHLQNHMFIPGVWGLAVSWFALSVLIGVAGFLFWRDAAAATFYEHVLGLWWVNLICLMVWFRLAKMHYMGAAFAVKLAVVGTAIAAVVLMALSGTWAPFGCYLVYVIAVTLFLIWAGRAVFGDLPAFKVKVDVELGNNKAGAEASLNAPLVQQQIRSQFSASAAQPINIANLRVPSN